jgi:glutaredoxin-like protein NrdH
MGKGEKMQAKHVDGTDKGKVMLYALSTCIWCGKTKKLLGELGVSYDYLDIDLLDGGDKHKALDEIAKYNPAKTFPTLVIGETGIRGFKEDQVRQALG